MCLHLCVPLECVYVDNGPPVKETRLANNAVIKVSEGVAYKCILNGDKSELKQLTAAEYAAAFGGGGGSIGGQGGEGSGTAVTSTTTTTTTTTTPAKGDFGHTFTIYAPLFSSRLCLG
jgi:hypothetical protein